MNRKRVSEVVVEGDGSVDDDDDDEEEEEEEEDKDEEEEKDKDEEEEEEMGTILEEPASINPTSSNIIEVTDPAGMWIYSHLCCI